MEPKILTIDDDKTVRILVRAAFHGMACQIFEASDGVEGLALAERVRPDLILLDCEMPVMDGTEMLARLRSNPDLRSIPVLMLTAETARDRVVKIAKLGIRGYVVKPFKPGVVLERVTQILPLKSLQQSASPPRPFDDPLQILVVDDKPAILEQIRARLASGPWKVHGCAQAEQAAEFCSHTLPDVIVISLSLPGGSGFTLFQNLRAAPRTRAIPLLALSVKTATEEQARAQQMGFNAIATKPIDAEDLRFKIGRALGLDSSQRYFQRRDDVLVLALPANFSQPVATDISFHLRAKASDAVDAGLTSLVIDMSQVSAANLVLVKLTMEVVQLCNELGLRYALIGSEAVCQECRKFEETKTWQFTNSFEQALALLHDAGVAA